MKPLHPVEYEVFHALARLKEAGKTKVSFSQIYREVNRKREVDRLKTLTRPAMAYHLAKLSERHFVEKNEKNPHFPNYSLVEGVFKLRCWPPLCMDIASNHVFVIVCEEIKRCQLTPLSKGCVEKLKSP